MKYKMLVPPPKANRMKDNGKIIIIYHNGWDVDRKIEINLEKPGILEFEIEDGYEWIYDTSINDGETFSVEVHYQNNKGTRKEVIHPVPEKVK